MGSGKAANRDLDHNHDPISGGMAMRPMDTQSMLG